MAVSSCPAAIACTARTSICSAFCWAGLWAQYAKAPLTVTRNALSSLRRINTSNLEEQPQSQLDGARIPGRDRVPEVRRAKSPPISAEVGVVEDIIELGTELQPTAFNL